MKEADVMKMVKKDKNLAFVDTYVKKERKNILKKAVKELQKNLQKS